MSRPNFIDEILAAHDGDLERAIRSLRQQVAQHPIEARLNLQVLLNAFGRESEAFRISDELMQIAPTDPRALFNRGWHMLKRGRLREGFALLEHGRTLKSYGNPPIGSSRPVWQKSLSRARGTVLMSLEGGLGDEIINVRFAAELAQNHGLKVVVACNPALASIFIRIPHVAAVAQKEAALGIYHDWWLPGMSAPFLLQIESPDLRGQPYLCADQSHVDKWMPFVKQLAGKKLRVGIRWAGSPAFEHQQLRKFPPDTLLTLESLPEVQLFSFQRDNDLVSLPASVSDLSPHLTRWEDTAALLKCMDIVISSCTSVAHMSAALGVPTWVIVPALPYFVWAQPGETSPWYDSARLFRQLSFGKWDDVRLKVREALELEARAARPIK